VKPESDSIKKGGDFEERIPNIDGVLRDPTAASTAVTVQQPASTACSPMRSMATDMRRTRTSLSWSSRVVHGEVAAAIALALVAAVGCTGDRGHPAPQRPAAPMQAPEALLTGQAMAIAYSGYRKASTPNGTARARNWTWSP